MTPFISFLWSLINQSIDKCLPLVHVEEARGELIQLAQNQRLVI